MTVLREICCRNCQICSLSGIAILMHYKNSSIAFKSDNKALLFTLAMGACINAYVSKFSQLLQLDMKNHYVTVINRLKNLLDLSIQTCSLLF